MSASKLGWDLLTHSVCMSVHAEGDGSDLKADITYPSIFSNCM